MPLCNSWVVVSRATGKPVFETWEARVIEHVNLDRYEVLTSYEWLIRYNAEVKTNGGKEPPCRNL